MRSIRRFSQSHLQFQKLSVFYKSHGDFVRFFPTPNSYLLISNCKSGLTEKRAESRSFRLFDILFLFNILFKVGFAVFYRNAFVPPVCGGKTRTDNDFAVINLKHDAHAHCVDLAMVIAAGKAGQVD